MCKKIRYESRKQAVIEIKNASSRGKGKQIPYHCKSCDYWHTTSMSKKQFRELRKQWRQDAQAENAA